MEENILKIRMGEDIENSPKAIYYQDKIAVLEIESSNNEIDKLKKTKLFDEPFKMDFFLILFCKEGEINLNLNLENIKISKNDILIVFPNTIFEISTQLKKFKTFVITVSSQITDLLDVSKTFLPSEYLLKYIKLKAQDDDLEKMITTYRILEDRLQIEDYENKEGIINGCINIITADIKQIAKHNNLKDQKIERNRQQEIFDKFVQYVISDCANFKDIIHYSEKLCLSPKYLSQVILSVSGRYAKDIISDHLILEAKALLIKGLTVTQVSQKLNFPNPSYFGVYFLKHTGMTPRKYMLSH